MLAGETVVITRARHQAADLTAKLEARGARVLELPTIEIAPPSDPGPLEQALRRLESYDWLIFTSVNGVQASLSASGAPASLSSAPPICAIGPATRKAVEQAGGRVALTPQEYVAEGVVAAFSAFDLRGKQILLPRAAVARDVVPNELRRLGASVDVVEAYSTRVPPGLAAHARDVFASAPNWITFTSSSTVRNFVQAAGASLLSAVRVASIGPVTSATCHELGVPVSVEASPYTTDGLVAAMDRAT